MPLIRPGTRIRGAVFDCDGVMISSVDANREFYNRILAHYGMPPMTPAQEAYSFMATARQALERLLPARLHPDIPRMGREIVDYRTEIMPYVKLFPGFLAFAEHLHGHGIRMAVLTNRTRGGMQAVLDFFSLPPYFNPVVTASSGFSKPDPGGALLILSQWGLAPEEVVYVGDSEVDRLTAERAGIPFAALQSAGRREPSGDVEASGYAELLERLAPFLDIPSATG